MVFNKVIEYEYYVGNKNMNIKSVLKTIRYNIVI